MSTITDILKHTKPFLLVELDINGMIKRFAIKNISIGDKLFEAKLMQDISISTSLNMENMRYSISSAHINIRNDGRFQDEESRRRMDGAIGRVYVWGDGLTWDDIETDGLILQGVFRKNYHTRNIYSFFIEDNTKSKFHTLPEVTINNETWPNHRLESGSGSVSGKAQPLLFGNWSKGVPLLCVDTVNHIYIISQNTTKSTDSDFSAATQNIYDKDGDVIAAANYTIYTKNDGLGNVVTYADFTSDQTANEPLSCSIAGIRDGTGEITGTIDEVINHPGLIIQYLMQYHSNMGVDEISKGDIQTMKSLLPAVKAATIINAEAEGLDIVNRILSQYQAALIPRTGGTIGIMTFKTTKSETKSLRTIDQTTDMIGSDIKFSMTPYHMICNNLEVQYALNPTTGQYEGLLTYNYANNTLCNRSYYEYGEQPKKIIMLSDVHDQYTAEIVASRYLDLWAFRHDLCENTVPYHIGYDIQEGDIAGLTIEDGSSQDGNGWTAEPCMLIEKKYDHQSIKQTWWRVAAK